MLAFAEAYLMDPKMNGSAAIRTAGYKCKPGNENRMAVQLLRHPLVKAHIKKEQDARRERMELTSDYVLTKLVDIVDANEDENPTAALRGLELLGRHLGLYRDRQEISGPDGEAIKYQQETKERADDFASRMAGLAKRSGTSGVSEFPKRSGEG